MPTPFYRRDLPHLQRDYKPHFLTFCTYKRWILPEPVRRIVLECCRHEHGLTIDLKVVVVMPDHVHMIFTPLIDHIRSEVIPLARITKAIKGASAHLINRHLGHVGTVWQEESFDHVLHHPRVLIRRFSMSLRILFDAGWLKIIQNILGCGTACGVLVRFAVTFDIPKCR